MTTPNPQFKTMLFVAVLTIAMGIFVICAVNGLFGPTNNSSETPIWIGSLAGLVFVAGGIVVLAQMFTEGSAPTPMWARLSMLVGLLTITGGLASIALWVALGPGPRQFQVSGSFGSGQTDSIIGRIVFGFGGVMVGIMFLAFVVSAAKQLLGRDDA